MVKISILQYFRYNSRSSWSNIISITLILEFLELKHIGGLCDDRQLNGVKF